MDEITRRGFVATGGAVSAVALTAGFPSIPNSKEQQVEQKLDRKVFGRAARYAVVPIEAVRMLNVRTDEQVLGAQEAVSEDMIASLEDMVRAAKAGRLKEKSSLAISALAW